MKIQLHSMTDLITNSSTVIYTYSDASVGALMEMVDEIFRSLNIDKKCEDVFKVSLVLQNNDRYHDAFDDLDDEDLPEELKGASNKSYTQKRDLVDLFIDKVNDGEVEKPQWMKDAEKAGPCDYSASNELQITPKSPEFAKLADLIKKFLYSTTQEASYDG